MALVGRIHGQQKFTLKTRSRLLCKTTSACALRARGFTILRELRGVNEEKILNFQSLRGEKGVILLFQVFSMYFHEIPKKHHASLSRFFIFI